MLQIFNKLSPRWIALTSLFYEGDISCKIQVLEHRRNRETFYNVNSLPLLSRICEENGYLLTRFVPFEIKSDIDKPTDRDYMGTYTRKVCAEGPLRGGSEFKLVVLS